MIIIVYGKAGRGKTHLINNLLNETFNNKELQFRVLENPNKDIMEIINKDANVMIEVQTLDNVPYWMKHNDNVLFINVDLVVWRI